MRYGTVCSGIEAPSVAWEPLGWKPRWFAEIASFPSAVLAHHFPKTPNLGDFTNPRGTFEPIDLLAGGTPCQAFSTIGRRGGLADFRGQLTFRFVDLAKRLQPRWIVWENVTGVLSIDQGQVFGAFLGALGECGYGFAYRVLDASFYGIPQSRRRVFVVGYRGDWRPPAGVLFEACSASQTAIDDPENNPQSSRGSKKNGLEPHGWAVNFLGTDVNVRDSSQPYYTIVTRQEKMTVCHRNYPKGPYQIRNLTPLEYERLQGFPDNFTKIAYRGKSPEQCPKTNRYRAVGNSIPVPVLRWLGQRIQTVDATVGNS